MNRLKEAALEQSQTFDISYQAQRMISVYEQAIEDKRAGRSIKNDLEVLRRSKNQLVPIE